MRVRTSADVAPSQVHDDVRVPVEDLGVAVTVPLEPALVDEPARADALDLLEDRTCAGVQPQVGMAVVAPAQVLADDPPQLARGSGFEAEGGGEDDVVALVQDAVVVAELEVVQVDAPALPSSVRISADSTTSSRKTVRSRSGARKCRFCHMAPPMVLGMPTK